MTDIDWASEIGVHADEAALETELATELDGEGSALTNRNDNASFWGVVKKTVLAPIYALEQLIVKIVPMGFLRHSSGIWLVEKAKEFGAALKEAVYAQGNITFSRTGTSGNVNIPKGSIVSSKTLADGSKKRMVTLADGVLLDGNTSVDVLCEAEGEGIAYNLADGGYSELVTPITGIEAVTNGAGWLVTAGVDEEKEQELKDRIDEGQQSGGEGWTGGDKSYLDLASNFTGVMNAIVDGSQPRGRGTVDVIIMGAAGQPTAQLISDLTDYLDEEGKPITDDLLVKGPDEVTVNIEVDAVVFTDDVRLDADIKTEVEAEIDEFFNYGLEEYSLKLGEDFVRGQVTAQVISEIGVKTLRFTTPAADVAVNADELAVAGTRVVTIVREDP